MIQNLPLKTLLVAAAVGGAFLLGRGTDDDAVLERPAGEPGAAQLSGLPEAAAETAWSSASPGWASAAPVWPVAGGEDEVEIDLDALMQQWEQQPQGQAQANQAQADMQALAELWAAAAMLGYAGQGAGQGWDQGWGQGGGFGGGSPADPWLSGGDFHGNGLLGTAVSSSGDSGYIALGDGGFVSW